MFKAWIYSGLSYLGFAEITKSVGFDLSPSLGSFQQLCLQIFLQHVLLLVSSWPYNDINVKTFCYCLAGSWRSVLSFSHILGGDHLFFVSLLFRLNNFYLSILKFLDCLLCHLRCVIRLIQWGVSFFIWWLYFSVLRFLVGSSSHLLFLCWTLLLSYLFQQYLWCLLEHFYNSCFKVFVS